MIDAPWYRDPVETLAFNGYAYHSQEVEDVIEMIGNGATSIQCDTDMSDSDMRYIENEVRRRYGLNISL
jgi:hypothetical protein